MSSSLKPLLTWPNLSDSSNNCSYDITSGLTVSLLLSSIALYMAICSSICCWWASCIIIYIKNSSLRRLCLSARCFSSSYNCIAIWSETVSSSVFPGTAAPDLTSSFLCLFVMSIGCWSYCWNSWNLPFRSWYLLRKRFLSRVISLSCLSLSCSSNFNLTISRWSSTSF